MSITVHIYYTGVHGSAKKFAREMIGQGVVSRIRSEDGNLQYDYFFPMDDEETVLLIDRWTDQRALDLHHQTPMMAQISALREKYDLHMRVERYVSEAGGIPSQDQAFIRS